jgi:hypothetical protein
LLELAVIGVRRRTFSLGRFGSQRSVLLFLRIRCIRPAFAYYQGLRFDIPAANLQRRVRSNRVFIGETRLDSPFLSGQQRDVIIFPEYRQYFFTRLPRFDRKSHLECQRRRCVLQADFDGRAVLRDEDELSP